MNTSELIAYARNSATIDDGSAEFTDAVITQLLNTAMGSYFEPIIESARSGFWMHALTRSLSSGNPYVRIHPRACALEQVDIRLGTNDWVPLEEALESESQDWDQSATYPQVYTTRGNSLVLHPAATTSDLTLRTKVTVRPSQLVLEQTAGRVTAVNTTTRVITLNSLPIDRLTASTIGSTLVIDCIEPRGFFELSLFDAPAAVTSSTTVLVDPGPSLSRIEVGDYLRVAGQTDWPQLPESYHNVLGSAAAVPICLRRDMYDRSNELSAATAAAAQRLSAQLAPRTRATNHKPLQHSWGR